MKYIITILTLLILTNPFFGQKVFKANREVYKTNKFVCEFYLLNDSTCYLTSHYSDNSAYSIYKGYLSQKTDTLYNFHYKPLIVLACNKRLIMKDNLQISINLIDTIMPSMIFKIRIKDENWEEINLSDLKTKIYKKDIERRDFLLNSKFLDPVTNKEIIMTVPKSSEPELSYFGSDTNFITTKVSISNAEIIIYPDNLYIFDKEKMTLIK